jgi:hypothetical protein
MQDIQTVISKTLADFRQVAALAGAEFAADKIAVEIMGKPHKAPKSLPIGRMAVYAFFFNGKALKVGKVGPKRAAWYTHQHYNPAGALGSLARSILANPGKIGASGIDPRLVGGVHQHKDHDLKSKIQVSVNV